ncbi:MAG: MBL fold metallo-hydrolase [Fimbriimonadaceae bacterium]|nr:MBL fold metallo-hydrolase [Fimbriimonadaceae bacterium]
MAEVVVLGSGTSSGVPTLGFDYEATFLAEPKNWRTRPSILIVGPTGRLLVDCAPEMRLQLLRERVTDVESVLVTHGHADHIMGMDDLRGFCLRTGRPMPVYAYPDTQEDIRRVFPYGFAAGRPGLLLPRFDLRDVPEIFEAGGLTVRTFPLIHGTMPVVGLRVGDFAYLTDVSEIPEPSWKHLGGLDTLVLDAVRYRPHPNHFHLARALEVAGLIGARATYLTHLSHDFDHHATESTLPDGVRLAYDGLRIPL